MAKWTMLLLSMVVLTGCASKWVYRNLDWVVLDYLQDYVELTDVQQDRLSERITVLTQWHQSTELPAYVSQLNQWLALDPASFSQQELKQQQVLIQRHYQRLMSQFIPEIYQLANELNDEQVHAFLRAVELRHQKYADKSRSLSEQAIRQRYAERLSDRMEPWFGTLTAGQEALLQQWAGDLQITTSDWIVFQASLRQQLHILLAQRHDEAAFSAHLQLLLFEPQQYYSPVLKAKQKYNDMTSDKYLVEIVRQATARQMRHFRQEVTGWKQLAQELNQDARSSARQPLDRQGAEPG